MKQIFPLLFILLTTFTSCRKTETNPCEGLLSESPPSEILVKFVDKQTKETILADAATIKITDKKSGNLYTHWGIYNRSGSSVLNGAISVHVFNESVAEYQFGIQLGDIGTAILSYKINRTETDNPCRSFAYPISDIKIIDQPFDIFQQDGKTYPMILVVAL